MEQKMPDLHDGFLDGFVLQDDMTLHLYCRDFRKRAWRICIPRIERLKAENFLEGNIIFEVNFYLGKMCPKILFDRLYGDKETTKLKRVNNDWTMIEVIPSYGCELLALAMVNPDLVVADLLHAS